MRRLASIAGLSVVAALSACGEHGATKGHTTVIRSISPFGTINQCPRFTNGDHQKLCGLANVNCQRALIGTGVDPTLQEVKRAYRQKPRGELAIVARRYAKSAQIYSHGKDFTSAGRRAASTGCLDALRHKGVSAIAP